MPDITVKKLNEEIEKCFEIRKEYNEINKKKTELYKKLDGQQRKCMEYLVDLEMTSFKSPSGTFSYSISETFRVPQGLENRNAFFGFLKEKGVYENMVTVNSQSLNTWAKAEIEASGELDYQIPGLEKSPPTFKASMRK